MTELDAARASLRHRLGSGARYDDPAAPSHELAWARTGTAYFARKLNELSDADLLNPTSRLARERRRTVAEVSYHARALAQCLEWIRENQEPQYDPFAAIATDAAFAVTLQPAALRNLFQHSEVHLNVEWRDLTASGWAAAIRLPGGREMAARATAGSRALFIWLRTVDLGNGGTFRDFPPGLIDAILTHAAQNWRSGATYILSAVDRDTPVKLGDGPTALRVSGIAADLAGWVSGREARNLTPDRLSILHDLAEIGRVRQDHQKG